MPENTNSKQRDNHCLPLWGVIAKVRPTPEHPSYYDWQHGFLVIVLYSDKPDSACAIAKSIIEQLPYEPVGAEVAVLDADGWRIDVRGRLLAGSNLGSGFCWSRLRPVLRQRSSRR